MADRIVSFPQRRPPTESHDVDRDVAIARMCAKLRRLALYNKALGDVMERLIGDMLAQLKGGAA